MENDVTEKLFLKNVRLVIALTENDSPTVEFLLSEGADINFIGSNGNTPLHYAVKYSKLEIVELILGHGANVNIENRDFDTPLDIAIKISKSKDIIKRLQNNIIKESSQIIENENSDQMISSNVEDNYTEDEITTDISQAVEKEIKKKQEKIKKCLIYLKNLNSDKKTANATYTHKHIITFIFFLDAIAFQDIEESGEVKREVRKELENKYGKGNGKTEIEINKELKVRKEKIKEEVVTHFRDNYYPTSFKEDQLRINKARSLLCHTADDKFLLTDFKRTLVCEGVSSSIFVEKLTGYVMFISDNIEGSGKKIESESSNTLSDLIQELSKKDVLKEENEVFDKSMKTFIYSIYNKDEWNQEEAQEQLFELLVNIFPSYQNEIRDLDLLRNKIIHDFSKYESIEEIINMEFAKTIYDLRSRLYKYYYAKEVFKILHNLKIGDECEEVDIKLQKALESFQMEFEKSHEGKLNRTVTAAEDIAKSSEYKLYKLSVLPGLRMEEIPDFVNDYLNFMSIIDYEKTDEERKLRDESHHLGELDHTKRREIFEKFKKLRQLNTYFPNQYKDAKKSFRDYLIRFYGVERSLFDEVCQLYLETKSDHQSKNERAKNKIIDTICILRRFQTSYYKYSIDDVITLYSRIVKEKGKFDMEKNLDLQKNYHLPELRKSNFLKEFDGLYKDEFVELTLKQKKIQVKTVLVVSNILRIFHTQYNSYHIKFNNITEAFCDKTFLDYLIDLEKKFKINLSKNFQKKNLTFDFDSLYFPILSVIFQNLIKLQYSFPFIARAITDDVIMNNSTGVILKEKLIKVLAKRDIMILIKVFLERFEFIDYLNILLKKICFEGVDLYEGVIKKLSEKDLEKMRSIFEDPVHVQRFMDQIVNFTYFETSHGTTKILKLLNNIINDFYRKGNFEKALQILDQYIRDDLKSINLLEILEAKRLKARVLNRIGEKKKGLQASKTELGTDAKKEFASALDLYREIKLTLEKIQARTFEENVIYILTLSHIAYTYHLLRNFTASYDYYEMVCLEVYNTALDLPKEAPLSGSLKEVMENIDLTKLKPYVDLIEFSSDTKLYLPVMKIRECMAFERTNQAYYSSFDTNRRIFNESALKIYQEIYTTHKKNLKEHDVFTADLMRRIAKIHYHLANLKTKSIDESKLHYATALNYYNRAYQIYKMDRDFISITKICKKISYVLNKLVALSQN